MVLRRHEQRLGSTTSSSKSWRWGDWAGRSRRIEAGDRRPARDGQRLPEGGGHCRCAAAAGRAKRRQNRPFRAEVSTDPGQNRPFPGGVHRLGRRHRRGVHRLGAVAPAPSASACEPYRELIVEALGRGRNAMAIWQDLVDDHGFTRPLRERPAVRRDSCAAPPPPEARVVITTAPGEEAPGRLRRRADGAPPGDRQVPAHAALRPDAGLLAQVGAPADVAVERADLGRAPRAGLSAAGRHDARRRPRQSERGRAHARHLRPRRSIRSIATCSRTTASSALPCRVARSRSQGQSRIGRRPRAEDAAARAALRDARRRRRPISIAGRRTGPTRASTARRSARSPRCLPRSGPRSAPLPARAVSLLPLRHAHRASRRLRRSRGRVLRAPPGWIGQRVQVQWNDLHVRVLDPKTGQLLREHVRAPRGWHRIDDADRPARTPRADAGAAGARPPRRRRICTPSARTSTSTTAPPASGASSASSRSPRSTAPAAVDDAAKAALELGVPTYRFLRRYLERRPPAPLTLRQVDPLIRQLTLYRDLIDRKTGDPA